LTLASGTRLGPYEIVAPIGAGGMGEVYRARDERLGREVALKILTPAAGGDPARVERFAREARAAAALAHPNVLVVHDVGEEDGVPYLVAELLVGTTLRQRLDRDARLAPQDAVAVGLQILRGLAAAHARGIVHRDIKPENVFVTDDGQVKILDFGVARLTTPSPLEAATMAASMTAAGVAIGTAAYMSPEQLRGQPVDARSDLWSFGVVLYELVAGQRPFRGDSAADTISAILTGDPPELATAGGGVVPALERVIHHCLEKAPEQRFQAASDVAFDLEALRSGGGAVRPLAAKARRGRALAWRPLAATALLVALSLVAGAWWRSHQSPPQPQFQRLTFRHGTLGAARFAPDGETIVYTAAWEGGPQEVLVGRLDSPESRPLGVRGQLQAVSSRGDVLIRDPDDVLQRIALAGGAPRALLRDVLGADWSPDGSELAVVRYLGKGRMRLEYPVGRILLERAAGAVNWLRVSPRDDAVAFVDRRSLGSSAAALVVVDRGGHEIARSDGWHDIGGHAWSPTGDAVWFSGSRNGKEFAISTLDLRGRLRQVWHGPGEINLRDLSRNHRVLLMQQDARAGTMVHLPGGRGERELSWFDYTTSRDLSADGSAVLLTEYGQSTGNPNGVTYLRRSDGSAAVRLGEGLGEALSPDGRWAIVITASPPRLLLVPTGPGEARSLGRAGWEYDSPARWFPDGQRLVVAARQSPTGSFRSYELDVGDGRARALTPEGVVAHAVSHDGRLLATFDPDRGAGLLTLPDGALRALPAAPEGSMPVRFGADGRSLFVFARGTKPLQVWRVDLAAGNREPWLSLLPLDPTGIDMMGNVRLTPDGSGYAYTYWRLLGSLYLVDGLR
jgi:hypothetical protein